MSRTQWLAAGAGALGSAAALAALSGQPMAVVLVYVAALPLLAAGLAFGPRHFATAAAVGLLVTLSFGGFTAAGLFASLHVIPAWLIVQQALQPRAASEDGWQPIGSVVAVLTLTLAFAAAAGALAAGGEAGLSAMVETMLTTAAQMAAPGLDESDRAMMMAQLAPLFLGFSATAWLFVLLVNAGLAQSVLARRGLSLRPQPRWSALRIPGWYDPVPVAVAVAALALPGDAGFLARNVAVILLAPYFLVGLAVVHGLARRAAMPTLLLTGFYLLLILFLLFAVAIVTALGVIEQWVGIRKRWPAAGHRRGGG